MELDQLKTTWDNAEKSLLLINEDTLHHLINQSSTDPVAKMKRNLKWEVFSVILLYGIILLTTLTIGKDVYLYYNILLIFAAILFFIYARYKYKLLCGMEGRHQDVKTNLNVQISSLEKLVKLYFKASNLSIALAYFFAVVFSYINTPGEKISIPETKEIVIILAIGIGLEFIGYYINRWYIFQLYGKHILKLKNISYEMDESNSN